jgi:hypothetical protein
MALAASLMGLALGACTKTAEAPAPGVLGVPHLRQETNLCVPTSAAMVLAYYGPPEPPRRLKVLAAGRSYDPGAPFDDFTPTLFRDLIRAVGGLGYVWTEQTYPDNADGAKAGLSDIEAQLRQRRPVLVDLTLQSIGHTVVLEGFDPAHRTLMLVDPDAPAPGRRTISYDQFAEVWNEHAYGGAFRALIVTRPRSGPA